MRTTVVLALCGVILLGALPGWSAEVDSTTRATITDWMRERDRAASQYLLSWLRGEPSRSRVSSGVTLIAREAGILALVRDRDPELSQSFSLLLGRRVSPETLPVILLEKRGVRFDPPGLFAGKTFALERSDR